MSDAVANHQPLESESWILQEQSDQILSEHLFKHKIEAVDGRMMRKIHRFGRRNCGQRHGFGNGERCNAKRQRWMKNRQLATRAANRIDFFDPFNPLSRKKDDERARKIRASVMVDL